MNSQPGVPRPTSVDATIRTSKPRADDRSRAEQPTPAIGQRCRNALYTSDPDGDIVHPGAAAPANWREGTTIRVRLLDRLSTADQRKRRAFRSRVASDVFRGGQVLIPAGTEIDGRVVEVSSGHAGGHGSMRLRPETVILPDGSRYPSARRDHRTPWLKEPESQAKARSCPTRG